MLPVPMSPLAALLPPRHLTEVRSLLRLAGPLVVAQLAQMAMSVAGTVVAGHLGVRDLAAQALGATTFTFLLISGYGLMAGLDPHIARAVGAGRPEHAGRLFRQGLWLALLAGVPMTSLLLLAPYILRTMGQEPALMDVVEEYLFWSAPGLVPALWFSAYRSFTSAAGQTRGIMVAAIFANAVNIGLCTWLAHGGAGVPAMGVAGIGLASVLSRFLMVAVLVAWCAQGQAFERFRGAFEWPRWDLLVPILRSGVPLAAQYGLEVTGFVLVTLWMGLLGANQLAAHEVAMTVAALGFQVPFAMGTAAAMRVGHAVGRRDEAGIEIAGWTALSLGIAYAVMSGIAMMVFRADIAALCMPSATPAVLALAAHFLIIAAGFQLADGAQAIGFGVLRGLDDTSVPMWFNLLGFGLLGLPIGYVGVFVMHGPPDYLWWGLTVALFVVATLLALRFRTLVRRRAAGEAVPAPILSGQPAIATE